MAAAPIAPRTGFKFMILVRQGPDKGATYQLLPPKVTMGRGNENNVVFGDPRVSRTAAVIEFSMEQITITDTSSRGTLSVNGQKVQTTSIRNGDAIAIGDTEFVFVVEAMQLPAAPNALALGGGAFGGGALPPPRPLTPPSPFQQPAGTYTPPSRVRSNGSGGSGKSTFYGLIAVVGIGFAWLMSGDPSKKRVETELRSTSAIERDIKGSEERTQLIVKKRSFASVEERTRFEEAQRHYLSGFRDYQDGQHIRAMRAFETAYTIDPNYELAQRYYKLAEKQRDEMVALLTKEGLSYKDKNMFTRCSAAFEKVMDALSNREDMKYKQAEALKKECDILEAERFE